MRVIDEFSSGGMRFSIFYMNQKFIVKCELNNLEQLFKVSELQFVFNGLEDLKKSVLNPQVLEKIRKNFDELQKTADMITESFA